MAFENKNILPNKAYRQVDKTASTNVLSFPDSSMLGFC